MGSSHGTRWGRTRWSGWSAMALVTFGTPSPPGTRSGRRWNRSRGLGSDLKLEISRWWCGRPSLTVIRTTCLSICTGRTRATSPNSPWTFSLFLDDALTSLFTRCNLQVAMQSSERKCHQTAGLFSAYFTRSNETRSWCTLRAAAVLCVGLIYTDKKAREFTSVHSRVRAA